MNPVSGGWTSHKTNDSEREYESQKRAAMAQSGKNEYVQGVQSVMDDGAGVAVQNTRQQSPYGNVNVMPNEVMQGSTSNFAQKDTPGNTAFDDAVNSTGSVTTEKSATNVPQEDPEEFEKSALESRLANMAKGGQGFPGLNNRSAGA